MGKLVLYLADGTTLDVKLDRERTTIGRRADNDVCLPYPAVSAEHAAVVTIFADSFLEDLGSTNGTQVNGKAITKHFLRDGEEIEIGRQRLVYVEDDSRMLQPMPPAAVREARLAAEKAEADRRLAESTLPPKQPAARPPRAQPEGSMSNIEQFIASEMQSDEPGREPSAPIPEPEPPAAPIAEASAPPVAAIRVTTGPNAGREVVLDKDEILVGRVGLQVAAVRRSDAGMHLVAVEGAAPPRVNGEPVTADGTPLNLGDLLEVAGAELKVVLAGGRESL